MELTDLQRIQEFYSKALEFLQKNDYKLATKVLYIDMPMDLYESSIDILFNRNGESDDKEFNECKQLIKKVDDKLVKFSHNKEDFNPDIDQFIGGIF